MKLWILVFLVPLICLTGLGDVFGQSALIMGSIQSENGEVLPFASIYSTTTDRGTSSDEKGRFSFSVNSAEDKIVFQYLGYEQQTINVDLNSNDTVDLDVRLKPLSLELESVTVSGDRNPADEIMREVIQRRAQFEELSNQYEAGVYIKGVYRIKDAPESILGIEIGGVDSILDGMPSDIIYLSETQSLYARFQNQVKEKVIASKTAGMQNFPSINRASVLDVNFYEVAPEIFGIKTKSPLANGAFSHYNFSYLGQYENPAKSAVHQIGVSPKRPGDPLFEGYIEIVDETWVLHAVNLFIDGRRLKLEFLDSVQIRQNFIDKESAPIPPAVQIDYRISGSAFGFVIRGGFTGVKKDLIFSPDLFSLEFDRTVLSYTEDALAKDSLYWESERPISLTSEERVDYQFKDSVENKFTDPEFIDSIDRERNKIQSNFLLTGYTYQKRNKGIRWSINSPLTSLFFNPVQGWNAALDGRFRKDWKNSQRIRSSFETYGQIQYGNSDKVWRSWGELAYKTGMRKPLLIKVTGGYRLNQVPRESPISLNANQFSNLFFKNHFISFYDQRFLRLAWDKNLGGGFSWSQQFNYERRSMVENTLNYSIFRKDEEYAQNIPNHADLELEPDLWTEHDIFLISGRLKYRPGLRYLDLPQNRIEIPGNWPEFGLNYFWGVDRWSSRADFLRLEADLRYNYQIGIAGYSNWVIKAGSFIRNQDLTFFDYRHFAGNAFYVSKGDYREVFMNLPYYQFSTQNDYLEFHWLHNFQGYLLNKVPGVRRLGLALEAKGSYLYHDDIGHYNEISLGIDRIGWGLFRMFRLDFVVSLREGQYSGCRLIFGSQFSFDDLQQEGTQL